MMETTDHNSAEFKLNFYTNFGACSYKDERLKLSTTSPIYLPGSPKGICSMYEGFRFP